MKVYIFDLSKNPNMSDINQEACHTLRDYGLDVVIVKKVLLALLLRNRAAQILSFGASPKNITLALICFILGCPCAVGIHDVVSHERADRFKVLIYNYILSKLCRIITFSEFSAQQFSAAFGRTSAQFRFKTDLLYFSKEKIFDFVMFGRFLPYQGVDRLPEIISCFPRRSFLFLGGDLPPEVQRFNNVTWRGGYISESDLRDGLSSSKVSIFPYHSATQSGGVPLAMAAGARPVAFAVGALPEQVGDFGYLASPGNVAEFVNLMRDALIRGAVTETEYLDYREAGRKINMAFFRNL